MARIYIKEGLITYAVETQSIPNSDKIGLSFRMVGENFPITRRVINSTDNVRQSAKKIIKSWVKT